MPIKDPKAKKEYDDAWRLNNKERLKIQQSIWRAKPENKAKNRVWNFKYKYGLNLADWNNFFEIQKGKCPICQNTFTKTGKRRAEVDHSHDSKYVRGLICHACNLAEGLLETPQAALGLYQYMIKNELLSYRG